MAARLDVWDPKCSLGSPLERPNGGDTIYSDLMGLPMRSTAECGATNLRTCQLRGHAE